MNRAKTVVVLITLALLGTVGLVLAYPTFIRDAVVLERLQTSIEQLSEPELIVFTAIGGLLIAFAMIDALFSSQYVSPAATDLEKRLTGLSEVQTGEKFDAALRARTQGNKTKTDDDLEQQVRSVATSILMRATGLPSPTIETHLENGTWTEDVRAAVFFTDKPLPFTYRILDWFAAENTEFRQVRHVISELESWHFERTASTAGSETSPTAKATKSSHAQETVTSPDGGIATTTSEQNPSDSTFGTAHRTGTDESVTNSTHITSTLNESDTESSAPDHEGESDETTQSDGPSSEFESEYSIDETVQQVAGSTSRIRRQDIGISVAFFATGLGLALRTVTPLLVAVVATVYAAIEYLSDVSPPTLRIERELGTTTPVPGDVIEITVRITNTSDQTLTDLRYFDGVPDSLPVVDGAPAIHTALRPDETGEFTYTIKSKRGVYDFDQSRLLLYSISGIEEWRAEIRLDSRIEVATLLDDFPIADNTFQRIGTIETDEGGSGIEFHSVREYQTGDPLNRIDWNQLAKTGKLSTVNFRRQRGTTVVLFLDAREEVAISAAPDQLDGLDLSIYAAEQVFHTLHTVGTEVGLFQYTGKLRAIEPDTGEPQRASVVSELRDRSDRYASARETTAFASSPNETSMPHDSQKQWFQPIARRLPRTAQIVLFSPVVDDIPVDLSRQFQAYGHPVSVVSPDVTAGDSMGCRVAALQRDTRIQTIRETGAYVADWDPEEPLQQLMTQLVRYHR